jgi:hypothetical protein
MMRAAVPEHQGRGAYDWDQPRRDLLAFGMQGRFCEEVWCGCIIGLPIDHVVACWCVK